jgi:hypothetical protein
MEMVEGLGTLMLRCRSCRCRSGQNHTFIGMYGVHTVFLAEKPPYIRSYTLQIYGSGQPYADIVSMEVGQAGCGSRSGHTHPQGEMHTEYEQEGPDSLRSEAPAGVSGSLCPAGLIMLAWSNCPATCVICDM